MSDFIAIASRCLQPLAERGFSFREERLCRGEVWLGCQRGDVEIRVCYEPKDRPWCNLYRAGRLERRLEVELGSPPDFAEWFFQTHAQEIEMWCIKLLKKLEEEKVTI